MYVLDKKKNKKNLVYHCKPQFFYIKVGFEGVYISRTCIPDQRWTFTPCDSYALDIKGGCFAINFKSL